MADDETRPIRLPGADRRILGKRIGARGNPIRRRVEPAASPRRFAPNRRIDDSGELEYPLAGSSRIAQPTRHAQKIDEFTV